MKLSRKEFERLALEQLDMLYRVARRLAHDVSGAEDLVQETFLRAIRGWETFHLNEYGLRPWLIRIMHNLHISRSQREQRQPLGIDPEHLDALVATRAAESVVDGFSFEAMDEQLARAVRQLPAEYQMVLLLWAIEELSYQEIADALEIPIGTVMSRLHRARQRLSEQLREHAIRQGVIRE
jgi:RNA polymerase sigma-70 factor (ECF subfamily)